ncbi:hypothetical protein ACXYMU_14295 [Pontibacter sp. CAU 1760]
MDSRNTAPLFDFSGVGSAMSTFLPHLLVQITSLMVASGGFILMALSESAGFIFMLCFLLFHLCLHFFIKGTNSYAQAISSLPLQVVIKAIQSVFILMGMIALAVCFYELFQWTYFELYKEHQSEAFYFEWHHEIVSLAPPVLKVGLVGELIRQLFPYLWQGKREMA